MEKHKHHRIIAAVVGLSLTIVLSPGCEGAVGGGPPTAAAAPVLGVLLNGLLDRVSALIREAETAGQSLLLSAGSQAYIAISNAQSAYNDSLQKTVTALDDVGTHNIQQLQSMVAELERRTATDIQRALQTAQTISNTLPFANHEPQVLAYSPRFTTNASSGGPTVIAITGNFFHAATQGYAPVLRVGSVVVSPVEVTTSRIAFAMPADATPSTPDKITTALAVLEVPFMSGLLKSRAVASFRLLLGTLPPAPGKVGITCTTTTKVSFREHKSTQSWQQHSSNDDLDSTNCGPNYPGWSIDPESVRFVVEWSQGDENDQWSKQQRTVHPTVCYFVHTVHHRFGTSGKVNWHYEFDVTQERDVANVTTGELPLRWGDSRSFQCAPNAWKVTFDSFLGQHVEFTGEGSEKYIRVVIQGGGITVKAPNLSEVDW